MTGSWRAPMGDYVELHAASAFSFLRGASQPQDLVDTAASLGLEALSLTDREGVYGAPRFHQRARECGLRAIIGAELTLAGGGVIPVLAISRRGYQNLCQLITRTQLASPKGEASFSWDEIVEYSEGLVALTGDADEGIFVGQPRSRWLEILDDLRRAFPEEGQVYVELNHHLRRVDPGHRAALCDLAEANHLPVLATNAARYATPAERCVADVFTCLRHHTDLDEAGRLLSQNAERHLKPPETMKQIFRDYPEAVRNTVRLADRIDFSLEDLGYEFPRYKVPAGETMDSFLRKLTWFGAEQRYGSLSKKVRRQLEHELGIIARLGFSGYFLIVWDIVNYCRETRVMVQGRGSAANSAVCYSLGITAVDPIGGGLLFERFLSEGRSGWPDIDLDLPSGDRRESVIQEVYRRYGKHGSAMTANVITYRGKSAIREIGKVLGFPTALINRFSNLYPHSEHKEKDDLKTRLKNSGIEADHPRAKALRGLYQRIYGLPRHLGQHSGGMIVCEGTLSKVVPLENASMPGRVVAQWDKDDCEGLGIVKVDLLGLGMMAAMQDAIELTAERGTPVDLAHLPKDDPATFKCMQKADTIGVFQIESRAQQATLPRMKPECFYDLAIEIAIIRPGPIQGDLLHPYLARRQGLAPVDYIDDSLEPVLKRTLGIPLFQEQMLRVAMIMADFSASEADELRRALNFTRDHERLKKVQGKMCDAMRRKGVEPAKIEQILQATSSFALYGFPESHAISFALLAYGSTYLKVHYPAEFYCALLNNQPMGFYSPATLVQDAKRRGVRFKPPCVRYSAIACTIADDQAIRLGLKWIKNVAVGKHDQLLAERQLRPFSGVADFRARTAYDKDELRWLGVSGALNCFSGDRRSALWEVSEIRENDLLGEVISPQVEKVPLQAMSLLERLQADYESVGLTVGSHPMKQIRNRHPELWRASDLPKGKDGQRLAVGGAVICRQRPGTAKGFVFVSLEDETGIINAILRPDFFEKYRFVVSQEAFLQVEGLLQNRQGVIHIMAEKVSPLEGEELPAGASHDFH
ncbi:MAG: error-prone DNA polymerase [Verrucomicrobiota bacterium]